MAKPLTIEFQGESVNLSLEKVERSKLYGYVDTEVVDQAGKRCELATLTGGHSIVGKGGTALAYLSPNGLWRKKSELKPVDLQGKTITPVKSTFEAPVKLEKRATLDEYLSHNINSIYQLTADEENEALKKELASGAIFQFPFSYRGGLEASVGFILLGSDGHVFMCVGTPTAIEYAGLKATAAVVPEAETTTAAEEEDLMDFSSI
jgi:hypothetical protein